GLGDIATGIVKGWVGHRKFLQKGQPVGRFIIQIDGENFKIGNPLLAQLSAQGVQQGQGGTAGAAPGCPEIQIDHFATLLLQAQFCTVVQQRQAEGGCRFISPGTGRRQQRQQYQNTQK